MSHNNGTPGDAVFIVEPTGPHTHTFLLLHGLGSNGERFGKELLETAITSSDRTLTDIYPGAKFVFPTSRKRRASAFNRAVLHQWFDITKLDDPSYRQERQIQGLSQSATDIISVMSNELELVPPGNLIFGGLSQGCAMSLAILLSLDHPLGGYIGMSGWLPYQEDLESAIEEEEFSDDPFSRSNDGDEATPNDPGIEAQAFARELLSRDPPAQPTKERTACSTPIFLGHGSEDEKVACSLGEAAARGLRKVGFQVQWKRYEGQGHWYKIPDEIDDIVSFISSHIGWSDAR